MSFLPGTCLGKPTLRSYLLQLVANHHRSLFLLCRPPFNPPLGCQENVRTLSGSYAEARMLDWVFYSSWQGGPGVTFHRLDWGRAARERNWSEFGSSSCMCLLPAALSGNIHRTTSTHKSEGRMQLHPLFAAQGL